MRLGIVARMDKSGLGYQTRNLCRMLSPKKVLLIDSTRFNNREQYPQWYEGYEKIVTNGFPNSREVVRFLDGLDAVLTCEIPYNWQIFSLAKGIKTYLQHNWEFLYYARNPKLPIPTKFIAPSLWRIDEMTKLYPNTTYVPPPTFDEDFKEAREINEKRTGKRRFLHIAGHKTHMDRNGTGVLINAVERSKADFELVIKSQHDIHRAYDKRITYDTTEEQADLYKDFDALILPRGYGGLCLPMNEALLSGLPVIMTDVSPNNIILPKEWLVPSRKDAEFNTFTKIEVFRANVKDLSRTIDSLVDSDLKDMKLQAYNIGFRNFSTEAVKRKWLEEL